MDINVSCDVDAAGVGSTARRVIPPPWRCGTRSFFKRENLPIILRKSVAKKHAKWMRHGEYGEMWCGDARGIPARSPPGGFDKYPRV